MRLRFPLFALLFIAGSLAIPHFVHAGIPFFGPIVPAENNVCPAGWGMFMTVINNIIQLLITLAIVFVAPLMIAWAGFLMIVNQGNASKLTEARGILINTVVGIVLSLAGWMIVDAVMAVLYNGPPGTWASLITSSGDSCLKQAGALPTDTLNPSVTLSGVNADGSITTTYGQPTAQCASTNTACSTTALQSAGLTVTQANVMSCIAVTESSGNPSTPPYNTTHPGSNSTACGTFQITQTTWNKYASGACSSFSNCQNAACNLQVAQVLVSNNGYSDWTCTGCNNKATACVQQYGG